MSASVEQIRTPPATSLSPVAEAAIQRTHWIAAVDAEMDRCWHWFESAIQHGFPPGIISHTKDDLKTMVINNDAQLWTTPNGACLTCVTVYPRVSIVQIWLMGGDYEELMTKHADAVFRWGQSIGASLVYVQGRKGWVRRLNSRGFKEHQAITCMELADYGQPSGTTTG